MGIKDEIFQKLRDLKPELAQKFFVSSIGVFGSVVRDDFSEKTSDIDLLVDFSKPIGIEFIDLAEYIEKKLDRKVDLISKNAIRQSYFTRIQKDLVYV
jgi:predicted nucleotidyltransferase